MVEDTHELASFFGQCSLRFAFILSEPPEVDIGSPMKNVFAQDNFVFDEAIFCVNTVGHERRTALNGENR